MNSSERTRRSKARTDARRLEDAWLNGPRMRITVMMPIFRVHSARRRWWRVYVVGGGAHFHFGSQSEAESYRATCARSGKCQAWKEEMRTMHSMVLRPEVILFHDYVRSMVRNEAMTWPSVRRRRTA